MAPSRAIDRFDRFWRRHGRTFWILHSAWALLTGAVILWLAHERYHFVYWVVGFLGLTWLSTLYFGRPQSSPDDPAAASAAASYGRGFASYLTRVLYQETLFFLIPFYTYSVVFPSWNVAFLGLLVVLAVLACLDLVFDRWLRASAAFSLVFFASVAFAALNLLLPMLFSVDPARATPLSAVLALVSAAPIALRQSGGDGRSRLGMAAAALAILAVAFLLPQLVPPAPLRLQEVSFAADLERPDLVPIGPVAQDVDAASLDGKLVVLARVFAPARVPARISLAWYRDDELLRSSREVEILAHAGGFRFWDALPSAGAGFEPGLYRVVLQTAQGRAFGSSELRIR